MFQIRSSLNKAFRRSKGSTPELDDYENEEVLQISPNHHRSLSAPMLDDPVVTELQRQLDMKEDLLTETRLEALNSSSQLQNLRETVMKLRTDLSTVRKENQDLHNTLDRNKKTPTSVDDPMASSILVVDCRHSDSEGITETSHSQPLMIFI